MKKITTYFSQYINAFFKKLFAVIFLFILSIAGANAQPLQPGQSVVTSYTFTGVSAYNVVRVIDLRNNPPFVTAGTYWNAPPQYTGPNWTLGRMRNVYGIAIDNKTPPNIFISSSSVNCLSPDQSDTGLIYRIDANTWLATNYISSTFAPGPPAAGPGVSKMPNTRPRIGNICYDNFHDQLFATNLEDGTIYRIKDNGFGVGNVEQFFDPSTPPFTPDNGSAGFAALGDRLFGIGVYGTSANNVKVYFSKWNSDNNINSRGNKNQIWSVALTPAGAIIPGTLKLEIDIPFLVNSDYSAPVADIEFSSDGDMLLGERSMDSICTSAHFSRILLYDRDINGDYLTYTIRGIGILNGNANSTGGVDFDYGMSDSLHNMYSDCDSVVVGTGDYLFQPSGLVYGVQMNKRSSTWISNTQNFSNFIDINNNLFSPDKTTPGDIDVYRKDVCADTNTCMSILRDTVYCDSAGTYIYEFQIRNNSYTKTLEQLEIAVDSPQPPNYVVAVPSTINVTPKLPPRAASQVYKVKLIGPGAVAYSEVCYTLSAQFEHDDCPWCCFIENCIKLPICSCAEVLHDSLYCVNGNYYYGLSLKNGTEYNVTKIQLTSPGVNPITFIPQTFHFNPPIAPGQLFPPNLTAQILGGAAGMIVPVRIKLFSNSFECCYFELSYRLPPCDTLRLNLSTFIQGRYDAATNQMVGDDIQVELRKNYSPYALVETSSGYLDENGRAALEFYNAENGTNYFIVVKHRNSLETWSKSPGQSFSNDVLNFDFLSNSQAFGNNLGLIDSAPLYYGILSGDINQDGEIDLSDLIQVYNDSKNFVTGNSDINGDGITDLTDLMIDFNNAYNYSGVVSP